MKTRTRVRPVLALTERDSIKRTLLILSYLTPPLLLLALGFALFSSTGRDDAHITYWPAYSLSHFGEMVNYSGERVEQSSSLLQVLWLAAAHTLSGIDIVTLGRVCSILFGVLSLVAVYVLAARIHPDIGFTSALLVGTSAYFVYWAFGGLESTLMAFAALCLVLSYADFLKAPDVPFARLAWPAGTTAMFVLVRPETTVVLVCLLIGALAAVYLKQKVGADVGAEALHRRYLKRLLLLLGLGVLISALVFAFRWAYFGSFFPQPVAAKADGVSLHKLREGTGYLVDHLFRGRYVIAVSLVTVFGVGYAVWDQLRTRVLNPHTLLCLSFLAAYVAFIVFSGGDWMEAGRFVVHLLPVAVLFVPFAFRRLTRSDVTFVLLLTGVIALHTRAILHVAIKESTGLPAWSRTYDEYGHAAAEPDPFTFSWFERKNRVHLREIPTIRRLDDVVARVTASTDETPLIMSGQMGMVLYHTAKRHYGEIDVIDRAGLADRVFTRCPLTADLPRRAKGLIFDYSTYFTHQVALEQQCEVRRPAIIVDALQADRYQDEVAAHGYTVVYTQEGNLLSGSERLPGRRIIGDQFIAVRSDLVPTLGDFEPVHIAFDTKR